MIEQDTHTPFKKKIEAGHVKIIFIITKGDIGGAQIHVRDLAFALQALGNQVTVLVGEEAEFTEQLSQQNIRYRVLNHLKRKIHPYKDYQALKEIRHQLRILKPDLVALHSSKAGIVGRLAAYLENIPATFTVHGWVFSGNATPVHQYAKNKIYRVIEKIGALLPARLIAVSHFDRDLAIQQKVCPDDKITTIHNGMADISPTFSANPSLHPPMLIMVARFASQKDHKTLIEALATLTELPWKLTLVGGDNGLLADTLKLITRKNLDDKIDVLGYKKDIPARLASHQIFVLSSHWEGLPLTIIEAMRAGLPVIASDVGGVSETVIDQQTGYLTHSREELIVALRALITDPKQRVAFGSNGRKHYEKHFTLDKQLKQTFRLYNEVLNHSFKPQ